MKCNVIRPPEIPTSSSSSDSSVDEKFEFLSHFVNTVQEHEVEDTARSRKRYVACDRIEAHNRLMHDYFVDVPLYNDELFEQRFRMSKRLFLKIVSDVEANFPWFREGRDACKKDSFTPLQKFTSAIRQLAYGNVRDEYDENLAMSARTSHECLQFFCSAIYKMYHHEFLHAPTSHDIALLYNAHLERHGIPGMLGSIDCTHWVWRNCPTRYRGQFHRGDHQYPTIILEAVASQDLWFWHGYFGVAGSNNDINVLNRSPLFTNELHGIASRCPFIVNGREYKSGYYLADGIYPSWSTFVKAFRYPTENKEKKLKKVQESARKYVERAFGVLKSKWAIINRPERAMTREKIASVMYACMILHNMVIKDEWIAISPVHIRDPLINPVLGDDIMVEL